MTPLLTISQTTARRYILGRQGLWPGRRWAGPEGVAAALTAVEAVQLDPLVVVARSHDIAFWGRVLDYQPEHLDAVLYRQRRGFDYGGSLFVYPMAELPYWRGAHMASRRQSGRWAMFVDEHPNALDQVRRMLREGGPVGNRELAGNRRVNSYRGRKDTALALFHLWLTGEVMIGERKGFERVYDLAERVAPPELLQEAEPAAAEAHFERKAVAFYGLPRETTWRTALADYLWRPIERSEARRRIERLLAEGVLTAVQVEGWKERRLALAADRPLLETLEAGAAPEVWRPLGPTTLEEVTLLAPLEIVSARGRARRLFDFDYVWEVYKPAAERRWGYYVLPILYGDRLAARLDPKLDRKTQTLHILGFWLEAHMAADDPAFAAALGRGLARFAAFLGAHRVTIPDGAPPVLRAAAELL